MKKKLVLTAAVIAALSVVSCNGKKTNSQGADQDSLSYAENDSLNSNDVILDSIAGTYEGTLPAADCPGIKTVLTLNADSTYQYSADYLERKDGHDEASGIFKVLANNVVEITRPSSGETSYYKVKDANSLIMTDSLGNEPEGAMAKHYVLPKKRKNAFFAGSHSAIITNLLHSCLSSLNQLSFAPEPSLFQIFFLILRPRF